MTNNKNTENESDQAKNDERESKKEIEQFITNCHAEEVNYSKEISTIYRQLAFAEGALFWYARSEFNVSGKVVLYGLAFLLFYFVLDALQYLSGMLKYQKHSEEFYKDYKEKRIYQKDNYEIPRVAGWVEGFFYTKLVSISISSIILVCTYIHYFN